MLINRKGYSAVVVLGLLLTAFAAGCAGGAAVAPQPAAGPSRQEASARVMAAEARQKEALPQLEAEFFQGTMQDKLAALWRGGYDPDRLEGVADAALKELLMRTRAGGYKVETAEGVYYPVVDYGAYRKDREAVTADVAAYIDIMAAESDRPATKDNAIVIAWAEVARRAVSQEGFIRAHGDSPQAAEVRRLYDRYVFLVFYGANNTPLFAYEDKVLDAKAKAGLTAALAAGGESRLTAALGEYLAVVAASGDLLTAEVDKHRQQAVKALRTAAGLAAPQ